MAQLLAKHLTVYSRPGCHLCDQMKEVIANVARQSRAGTIVVDEIDVSTDRALEEAYGKDLPVLFIDGRQAAKHRITADQLRGELSR